MKPQKQVDKTKFIKKQKNKKSPVLESIKPSSSVHQLPTIQNILEIPQNHRLNKSKEYFQQVKPFLASYMQKKVGSRVLQLLFKWGDSTIKTALHQCTLKNWKDLIKSKYSLYLLAQIGRDMDLPGVVEDVFYLQGFRQGAKIVQNFIQSRGQQGSKKVKDKFYSLWQKSKEGDIKSQQLLHNLSLKCIQKQYDGMHISKLILRLSIHSMFLQQKQKVLNYLIQKVSEWTNDDQGVRLFIEVVNSSDAKQKKQIVRAYKGHVLDIIQQNSPCYVTFIKLITQIDDTVFVDKLLNTQIQQLFPLMSSNKHAFGVIFSLFSPRQNNFNVLGKYQHTVSHTECKKDEQIRKSQLRSYIYPNLLLFLDGQNLYHILCHHMNNKLLVGLYKSLQQDGEIKRYNDFIHKIAKYYLTDAKDHLLANSFQNSLVADVNANKIIKNILILTDAVVDYYCDQFAKLAVENISDFLHSKASYVLLGLIQKGGREYLLLEVKKSGAKLEKVVAGQIYLNLLKAK